MNQSIISHHYS